MGSIYSPANALAGASIADALTPPGAAPSLRLALACAGGAAALAPDLDCLFELGGKLSGWRHHRVALHSLPAVALLAVIGTTAALQTAAAAAGAARAAAVVVAALASHLVLDVVTSFGTALLHPLTRRRFSTRSAFIVDPVVLGGLAAGLGTGHPGAGLAAVGALLGVGVALRRRVLGQARRSLARLGLFLEPGAEPAWLAPWRWLVIARAGDDYLVAPATPVAVGTWQRAASGLAELAAARRHPLLAAFLDTCDFPRFERRAATLIVEDVKWWVALPLRPLAFAATLRDGAIVGEPRQSRLTDRGPAGPPEPAPLDALAGRAPHVRSVGICIQ
jgi:inner membrane protein